MAAYRKRSLQERFWEVLPGLQFWSTLFLAIYLSARHPYAAALFIICFDFYWLLKAVNVSSHLIASYRRFRIAVTVDWEDFTRRVFEDPQHFVLFLRKLQADSKKRIAKTFWKGEAKRLELFLADGRRPTDPAELYHLVLFPFYDETEEVLASSLDALSQTQYRKDRIFVVLASEQRAGESAQEVARKVKEKYKDHFGQFFITTHPDGLEGEIRGKSANASYAVQAVMPDLAALGIAVDQVMVSNFDSDTVVHPQYFARVAYCFITAESPYRSSYQPIAVYNNNIWDSPSFIRVVSVSNSFWQFTESSRPNRLRTFSSHSMTLRALVDVGFWKKDLINEDGFIFWQCYLHYKGDYRVQPLFLPISLDTCLAPTTWQTLVNQYKQKRRWAYNVEYYPHLIPKLIKLKAPAWDRFYKLFQYVEGNFNWATASILISTMGLLPLFLGDRFFLESVVAYNLPTVTRILLNVAMVFLIFSVYINAILLPPRPKKYKWTRSAGMYLQWVLVPIISIVFGSLPAIDAQTRLMLGKYLEFWVTPKARKGESTGLQMREMQSTNIRQ